MRVAISGAPLRRLLSIALSALLLTSCATSSEERFAESRARGCSAATLAISVANEAFSSMRIKLEEDDFEGFYETGNLVANLGVSLERAAETEDVGFKSALRGLAQGLAELGGGQISTDFMPLRTQNVVNDYFAMKAHHSAYLEDAVANVVSEGVDLIQYCP